MTGYRGVYVCDHVDHSASSQRGSALVREALAAAQGAQGRCVVSGFDHSGSGHVPVGGPIRWWDNPPQCTHAGRNVCQICAELTDDEAQAIREYFAAVKAKRETK